MLPVLAGQLSGSTVRVTAAGTPLANVDGAVLVESIAGLFLIARTGANTFSAIDAVCTHEGCTINGADGSTVLSGTREELLGNPDVRSAYFGC
jgi:Rieske Fe-S protein